MAFFPGQPVCAGLPVPEGYIIVEFTEAETMRWQWHQLDHMKVRCTSLQTDNHASTYHSVFYGLDALPVAQPTASKH